MHLRIHVCWLNSTASACVLQEVTITYNLCNEPWLKYSMAVVADRGLRPSQWTSARLYSEVMYVETAR